MNRSSFAEGMFSKETLVGEIKPLVTAKNDFDYRDKSELLNFFQNFLTIGIKTEIINFNLIIFNNCQVGDCDLE